MTYVTCLADKLSTLHQTEAWVHYSPSVSVSASRSMVVSALGLDLGLEVPSASTGPCVTALGASVGGLSVNTT